MPGSKGGGSSGGGDGGGGEGGGSGEGEGDGQAPLASGATMTYEVSPEAEVMAVVPARPVHVPLGSCVRLLQCVDAAHLALASCRETSPNGGDEEPAK